MTKRNLILTGCTLVALVLLLGIVPVTAKKPAQDSRCIAHIEGFPKRLVEGERYEGVLVIENQTDEQDLWYDITYSSNLGAHNPQGSHIMALNHYPRLVGLVLYAAQPPEKGRRGYLAAEIMIGGTKCTVAERHMVVVPSH
jgi:hypothetical protein